MFRTLTAVLFAATLMSPALALEDFSQARCEDQSLKDYMSETIPQMVSLKDGQRLSQVVQIVDLANSTTMSASANMIVCRVKFGFRYGGYFDYISGRFSIEQMPDGRQYAKFKPL